MCDLDAGRATLSSNGGSVTQFSGHGIARKSSRLLPTHPHGKLLLSRAKRELASLERLAVLSASLPLANEAWRILLRILIDTLQRRQVTASGLAKDLKLSPDIAMRYLRALESERLVMVCAGTDGLVGRLSWSGEGRVNASGQAMERQPADARVSIGDEGILRVARYFLPEAANE